MTPLTQSQQQEDMDRVKLGLRPEGVRAYAEVDALRAMLNARAADTEVAPIATASAPLERLRAALPGFHAYLWPRNGVTATAGIDGVCLRGVGPTEEAAVTALLSAWSEALKPWGAETARTSMRHAHELATAHLALSESRRELDALSETLAEQDASRVYVGSTRRMIEAMIERVLARDNPVLVANDYSWEHGHGPDLRPIRSLMDSLADTENACEQLERRATVAEEGYKELSADLTAARGEIARLEQEVGKWMAHTERADVEGMGHCERADKHKAEIARLREAVEGLLADPYGCPFCDSGVLRRPLNEKDHATDCPYAVARIVLASGAKGTP